MPPHQHGAPDFLDSDISFVLDRLFDPYNMDHIPEDQRLDLFKKRNLGHIKSYKSAVRIFGGPLSRKRLITAPPMETPLKHRLGLYLLRSSPPLPLPLNSQLKPQEPPEKKPSEDEVEAQKEKAKYEDYQQWISDRKKLRQDLNNIGLCEKWLQGKAKMTELESRVMTRIRTEKAKKPEEPKIVTPPPPMKQAPPVPVVKIPSPSGLQILDEHLIQKKIRLVDLFKLLDKDKTWAVSKEEIARRIKEAQLVMTEQEIENLVLSLDTDINGEVDYAELAKGMVNWKRERRDKKRDSFSSSTRSPTASPATSRGERSQSSSSKNSQRTQGNVTKSVVGKAVERTKTADGRPTSTKSSNSSEKSKEGSSTPRFHLEPPESDTRLEQMILSSDETMVDLRKHDHVVLSRSMAKRQSSGSKRGSPVLGVIKTGSKAIDNHSLESTLGGRTGEMINQFRQMRLKEYYDVVRMCEQKGVPLTPALLDRVLLYPPDQPPANIKKSISQPGGKLLTTRFASSPKPPRPSLEIHHKDRLKRTKSGKLLIDSRHIYPSYATVARSVCKETLSTGRALISRKVDCWMTFEEYDELTGHLAIQYKQLHGNVDKNAFWPGHLLNKLQLYMPSTPDRSQAIFSNTHQPKRSNPGYNNDLQSWPVGPEGHVTYAPCVRH